MKEKPNIAVVEDTEEMREWRGSSQSEMGLRWKKLAARMEDEVLENTGSKKAKERPSEVEGGGRAETRNTE